jgi:DNA-binding Lrp family transcriptional regulator
MECRLAQLSGYPDSVAKDRSPWHDGRRAWERLKGWHQEKPGAQPGGGSGDGALAALADVGLVRRLLDQAELVAVRTARQQGKSWAEIATRLGVTRQSAWERWRDLDEETTQAAVVLDVEAAAAAKRAAQLRRRVSSVTVPNVIGMSWDRARDVLHDAGLIGVGTDPDGPPSSGVVTDQSPESGARVPAGAMITLWVDRGGGSGVREPRRPIPEPRSGRALRDELSNESVG